MRCPAAILAVLLASAAASAADKTTPIELSTNAGTTVTGTVSFATLKIKCDLGNMDVPIAKIDRISSASADSHWICLKSRDQIHATIQEPKELEITTEFGRFKADWKQVSHLDIGAKK
jgi:hypothetical protein